MPTFEQTLQELHNRYALGLDYGRSCSRVTEALRMRPDFGPTGLADVMGLRLDQFREAYREAIERAAMPVE